MVLRSSNEGEFGVEVDSLVALEFFRLNFCLSAAIVASNPVKLKLARLFVLVVGDVFGLFSRNTGGKIATPSPEVDLRMGISSKP